MSVPALHPRSNTISSVSHERGTFGSFRNLNTCRLNQARNLGLRGVDTKYIVFLDNDALVTPGWLESLVQCAEETDAWVVGPLYFLGEFERQIVHMAGGALHMKEQDGKRILYEEQYFFNTPLADVGTPFRRQTVGHLEFHCLLARTDVFERLGPLDEGLLSVHEHLDFCMAVREAGGSVYIEPKAVTTYIPPPPAKWSDLAFFMLRWSEEWNLATVRHFNDKWGVSSLLHISDTSNSTLEDTIIRFARGHRRLMSGLRVSETDADRPESPLEQAELAIAILQSLDRDRFEVTLTTADGSIVEQENDLGAGAIFERMSGMLARADEENLNLMIRPLPLQPTHPVAVLRLDDLDAGELDKVRPHAFLMVATGAETYQCWLAVNKGDARSAALWRRLGVTAGAGGTEPVRIAGSKIVGPEASEGNGADQRVRLVEGCCGLVTPLWNLEEEGLLPLLRYAVIV
jgi:GT2 family glycosyltransferase